MCVSDGEGERERGREEEEEEEHQIRTKEHGTYGRQNEEKCETKFDFR